ncbi:MAG: helix-turn-helix domain-containing protein [Terriglobia bacterium]
MNPNVDGDLSHSSAEDLPDLLTAKDLERLLKIDVKTIYSYAQKGLLPYVRIQSNLRFEKSEILHWIEEHRFRPKSVGSRR